MLVAETHGKHRVEVEDDEDYLTSSVFGHLRYVPPSIFWENLIGKARATDGVNTPLAAALSQFGVCFRNYKSLAADFWRFHPKLGEPDVILTFSGGDQKPLVLVIEAKLWAGKS